MTELLISALETVRRLPQDEQDNVARMMIAMSGTGAPETIHPEHLEALLNGLQQAKRGEFISDEQVKAAFRRFDP